MEKTHIALAGHALRAPITNAINRSISANVAGKIEGTTPPDAEPEKGYFYRSDHISLAKKGVPMLYADSGIDLIDGGEAAGLAAVDDYTKNRYHKPTDEYSDDWDLSGLQETMEMFRDVGAAMAYSDIQPNWFEGNEFRALRDAQMAE